MRLWVIIIILTGAFAGGALADYHYASHEGSDEYPYTSWETAADSIQKAIDASSPGDTVYVGAGTFVETLEMKDTLALIGLGRDSTIVDGMSYEHDDWSVIFSGHNDFYQGMFVYGRYGRYPQGDSASGINTLLQNIIIRDCYFFECKYALSLYGYGDVENCVFEDNETNVDLFAGGVRLVNNTFYDVIGFWAQFNLQLLDVRDGLEMRNNFIAGHTAGIMYCDSCIIANNLFVECRLSYRGGYPLIENNSYIGNNSHAQAMFFDSWEYAPTIPVIRNDIITGMLACGIGADRYIAPCSLLVHHDLLYDMPFYYITYAGAVIDSSLGGNLYVDPMFADTVDFELQMFSPAIDAGDPEVLDVDGTRSDMGFLGGPFGRSYEYQDLPPQVPRDLSASVSGDTITINWRYNTESDFGFHNVYRETYSGFVPSPSNLIASPDTSVYYDLDWDHEHDYFYRITAVDNQGNESEPSEELAVFIVGAPYDPNGNVPRAVVLEQNYPNPFNPLTTIKYHIPNVGAQPAEVELSIYDVLGKEVIVLVKERRYPGSYSVSWDGKDSGGHEAASGIYFYRLKVWGIEVVKPRKMVLVR